MRKNIWVFGGGYWASILIPKILHFFNESMVHIVEPDSTRVAQHVSRFPSLSPRTQADFLQFAKPHDMTFILTPPHTHFELCKLALSLGSHVWCEKPLTLNSEKSAKLIEIARDSDLTLFVDNTFLFDQSIVALVEDIGQRKNIHRYHSVRRSTGKIVPNIGVVWDLLPHDLSILSSAFSDYSLKGIGRHHWVNWNGERNLVEAEIELETPYGTPLYVSLSCVSGEKTRHIDVLHEEGISAYSMTSTGTAYRFYGFLEIPGYFEPTKTVKSRSLANTQEPLDVALMTFQDLAKEGKQHSSLSSNVRETEIIEQINTILT